MCLSASRSWTKNRCKSPKYRTAEVLQWSQKTISENAGGHWHGTRREHHIWKISHSFQHGRDLPGGIIPASVSERFCLPEMRLYGILPGSRAKHVPVPRLPTPDLRHRWNRYAPHAPAADGLVLDDLSLCHVQTRHFCRSAESYVEHLLWVGVVWLPL